MKSILSFVIWFFVGIFTMSVLNRFSGLHYAGEIAVISLIGISIILTVMSIYRFQKIKSLNKKNFGGEEEDEVEERKYKMFSDYSLYANSSFVLSILALSFSLITTQNVILTIASVITLIITFLLIYYMMPLKQLVYPERNITASSDPDYTKALLDNMADDGEKHVILDGLFKSHSLLNISLIGAMILSTLYSISRGNSEIFSIVLMAIVLLIVNGTYVLVVRNK